MTGPGAPFGVPIVGNDWSAVPAVPARTVSVVVAHYAQQAELDRTLAALARQTHPRQLLEVVVADDGSPTPPTVPPGVRVVRQEDRGFRLAAVRNLGARHATGDVVCFLDADTAPEPEYVARIAALPSAAPDVLAVGRRRHADLRGVPMRTPIERAGPEHALPEPQWLADAYARSGDLLDADARSYRFAIGAVLACSRWLLDDVGGFDETFDAYGGEDWEWAARAWRRGAALAHVPDAIAWHDGPDWAGRDAEERARRKDEETLRLVDAVGGPGLAPSALLSARADVVVVLERSPSVAAALVCVDRMLALLPTARVVVPAGIAGAFAADPRVLAAAPEHRATVTLAHPIVLGDAGAARLLDAVATIGDADVARIALGDAIVVAAPRAAARDRRWGRPTGWRVEREPLADVRRVPEHPDLEAHLGGWSRA
ncbi:glycosyltransferase family 2 protein [Agrococcus jejuensis]|uniref:glycosyltransferase family 2 protein n=1 Tax=Agrococcus jejuensis TaxID=399736 RepID=UPI001C931317|nr:glycosyltransferase family 2 protein [Agrococcus jejuensis]